MNARKMFAIWRIRVGLQWMNFKHAAYEVIHARKIHQELREHNAKLHKINQAMQEALKDDGAILLMADGQRFDNNVFEGRRVVVVGEYCEFISCHWTAPEAKE